MILAPQIDDVVEQRHTQAKNITVSDFPRVKCIEWKALVGSRRNEVLKAVDIKRAVPVWASNLRLSWLPQGGWRAGVHQEAPLPHDRYAR